jgi:hypothetical protein
LLLSIGRTIMTGRTANVKSLRPVMDFLTIFFF